MRILYVITGLGIGGAERVVSALADAVATRGHEVRLAYLTGEALTTPKREEVKTIALNMRGRWQVLAAYMDLRSLVNEFQPDVVHSHMVHANILCRLLRLTTRMPLLITTAHTRNEEGRLRMLGYRLTRALPDLTTNVSAEAVSAFEEARAVRRGEMVTVYNGIDLSRFAASPEARERTRASLGINEHCKMLLAVGRLSIPKDYPNLMKAVRLLVEAGHDQFHVLVAGEGPLRSELAELSVELGIADRVNFLGVRHDVPDLLAAADIYVLSSSYEGFPMAVGEAMAAGKVIVATDCGGVREFLGDAGLTVPVQDASSLARALSTALHLDDDARRRKEEAVLARVRSMYSEEMAVERWLRIYQRQDVLLQPA